MTKMRWHNLEWRRKILTHQNLPDPTLSLPDEPREVSQRERSSGRNSAHPGRLRARRADRLRGRSSFQIATLKAVERVMRERQTQDPAVIAKELGIKRMTASQYLAEIRREA